MYPIHDLYVRPLDTKQDPAGSKLELLRYSDHLLRRFGLAEIVFLDAAQIRPASIRNVADEIWALVNGSVQFNWEDRRPSSPTLGATYQLLCEQPTLVLVPFGVEFEVQAVGGSAEMVRLATHESEDE
jgi:dTDP-4-dehydrorhamnose 3,5-epimerase-like enzyme